MRGESSPHYTNRPRFEGVAARMHELVPGARIVYMVRDPIDRMLSHYVHNAGGGYDDRPLEVAFSDERGAYFERGRYAFQLEPYLEAFGAGSIEIVGQEELKRDRAATMRRAVRVPRRRSRLPLRAVRPRMGDRDAKPGGSFRLMDRAVRIPGLRALDRNFDRLPESLRWLVDGSSTTPAPARRRSRTCPPSCASGWRTSSGRTSSASRAIAGRRFGWLS